MAHPLDAPCRCGHPLWLHTNGCLALLPGVNQMRSEPCGCDDWKARQ